MTHRHVLIAAALAFLAAGAQANTCIDCHQKATPGIVADWQLSKHSGAGVECAVCHGEAHQNATDAAKAEIPTPETCAACHETQVAQFKKGKHALAWAAMKAMPTAHAQPVAMMEGLKGCGGCHKLGLKSEAEVRALKAQGRGFGMASCDACHTRHSFSVREARQPQACQTCHMGFDHPQWEMYSASKHGVRALLKQNGTLPASAAGPTCQDCHMQQGNHEVRTAWGFLAVRLRCPGTSSGPPTRPPSCRAWACSTPTASPPGGSTWSRLPTWPAWTRPPGSGSATPCWRSAAGATRPPTRRSSCRRATT